MNRLILTASACNGFVAVVLGAFGAHGLKSYLATATDGALRLQWWDTASTYHLAHALALGLVASAHGAAPRRQFALSAWCLQIGVLLFCGSLYTMTLTGTRGLGAITPLGGLFLLAGWLSLAIGALRGNNDR